MLTRRTLMQASAATLFGAAGGRASAQDPFYAGRGSIEIIVGATSGSGGDIASRYMAPFLSAAIEGNPAFRVVNVPGGSAMLGANQFAQRPADGYHLLASSSSIWVHGLLGNEMAQYDLRRLVPIIGIPANTIVSIASETGFEGGPDLLDPDVPLVIGAGDAGGAHVRLVLAFEILKLTDAVQFVFGYEGGGATRIAYEQGEINICAQATPAYLAGIVPMEAAGLSRPLFQLGRLDDTGQMVRDPAVPDIKTVREVYVDMYGEEPSGPAYEALKAFDIVNAMQIALVISADAPEEAIAALQAGAESVVADPAFMAGAEAAFGTTEIVVGAGVERMRERLQNLDEEPLIFARRLATERYGVRGLRY
jgi:tripartite-type tricarboxylate transporter receptor subunit TctC